MSSFEIPQASASWPASTEDASGVSVSVCTLTVPEPVIVTMVCAPVASSDTVLASSTEHVAEGREKSAPPLNSIPKLSPRPSSAPTLISKIMPLITYHVFQRPTKLIETSPRYNRCPITVSLLIRVHPFAYDGICPRVHQQRSRRPDDLDLVLSSEIHFA